MDKQAEVRQQRLMREKRVHRYLSALERGDMDTIISVLHEAERDPVLEQMIVEAHEAYQDEDHSAIQPAEAAQARDKVLRLVDLQEAFEQDEIGTIPSGPLARKRRYRFLFQTIAAVLIVGILIGSAYLLFARHNTQVGSFIPPSGTWKIVAGENPGIVQNSLNAVAAISANDAWAVGYYSASHNEGQGEKTLIEHWNGSSWSVVKSPNAALDSSVLTGIAALASNNVWAVGYAASNSNKSNTSVSQTLIEHWNGFSWMIINSPDPGPQSQLYAVAALAEENIWAVGSYGGNPAQTLVEHWNGSSWTVVPSPNPGRGDNFLDSVAALSANDIWAAGSSSNGRTVLGNQETLVEHWNGKAWSVVQSPNPGMEGNFFSGIAAIATNDVWAVGGSNASSQEPETLIEHWDGIAWSVVKSPNPGIGGNVLNAVTAVSADNVWAAGYSPRSNFPGQESITLVEHWNGSAWSAVKSPNSGSDNNYLFGIAQVPSSGRIWAVGSVAVYGPSIPVSSPNATRTTYVSTVTFHVIIESCCS